MGVKKAMLWFPGTARDCGEGAAFSVASPLLSLESLLYDSLFSVPLDPLYPVAKYGFDIFLSAFFLLRNYFFSKLRILTVRMR